MRRCPQMYLTLTLTLTLYRYAIPVTAIDVYSGDIQMVLNYPNEVAIELILLGLYNKLCPIIYTMFIYTGHGELISPPRSDFRES